MKIKDGFLLRTISGETVVIPMDRALDLNMMIRLNDTGRFLWEHLQEETTVEKLVAAVLSAYNIDAAAAISHVEAFINELEHNGFLI